MTSDYHSRRAERDELVLALMQRKTRIADGNAAVRKAFPDAPQPMIDAGVHHAFVDGTDAALDWVADAERFLRDPNPSEFLHDGRTWDAIYHLYGWVQFRALIPYGREGLKSYIDEIRQFIVENDAESALSSLHQLEELFDGDVDPPLLRPSE